MDVRWLVFINFSMSKNMKREVTNSVLTMDFVNGETEKVNNLDNPCWK